MRNLSDRELLERIDRRTSWIVRVVVGGFSVGLFWLAVLTVAVFGQSSETYAAARADRQQFPQSDWGYLYYISADAVPEVDQLTLGRTTAFVVSSFSTSVVLEQHLPAEVSRGLWRIDLRDLNWNWRSWHSVLKSYPYRPDLGIPLVIRADWLVQELADSKRSQAGYLLLYGKPPKTLAEFQKFWNVRAGDPKLALLHLEAESGVSLLNVRLLGNEDAANRRTYYYTQDNDRDNFNVQTDPLESLLDPKRKHDASEHIVQFVKTSIVQGIGGSAQQYFLANGAGAKQDAAPVSIVEDTTRFRGAAEIVNFASCVTCHTNGLQPPTRNDLRELIASGVELFADKKSQQLIEQQALADVQFRLEISQDSDAYVRFVAMATGWSPEENVRAFKKAFENYDADLTLEDAARELYVSPKELTNALGYASANQVKLGARIAGLAHGRDLSRNYFESEFGKMFYAVRRWEAIR